MLWKLGELSEASGDVHAIPKSLCSNALTRTQQALEKSSRVLQKVAKGLPRSGRRHSHHRRNGTVDDSFSQHSRFVIFS